FDEHNIKDLFEDSELNYDAIFFAMNALDSKEIYDACNEINAKEKINKFLDAGKGLYIGYSSKENKREFLPEKYNVHQKARDLSKESQNEGELLLCQDTSFSQMLNDNMLKDYIKQSKEHLTIKGLYFSYLEGTNFFQSVIIDKKDERTLLAVSDTTSSHRIVITTLPIDWQEQQDIFINIIKYCAEGVPVITILSNDNSTDYFGREYLFRQLGLNKIPYDYNVIAQKKDLSKVFDNFEVVIFDSTWTDEDIKEIISSQQKLIVKKNLRIFHFSNNENSNTNQLHRLSIHSAYQSIDKIEKEVLIYLINKTFDYGQSNIKLSILTEIEVLRFNQRLNHHNSNFCKRIIDDIEARIQKDGSYASMFVASCNAIHLLSLCAKENQLSKEYLSKISVCKKLLSGYISTSIMTMKKNIDRTSSYELASSIYYLENIYEIDADALEVFIYKIINTLLNVDGAEMTGFAIQMCFKVLIDNIELVKRYDEKNRYIDTIKNLVKKCSYAFDNFDYSYKVAAVSIYVMSLLDLIKNNFFSNDFSTLRIMHKSLFSAIDFLYKSRNQLDSSWDNDIYATCLAAQTLSDFSSLSTYPIDELLILLSNYCVSKNITTLDGLVRLAQQQEEKINLVIKEKEEEKHQKLLLQDSLKNNEEKSQNTINNLNNQINQKEQKINEQLERIDNLKNRHLVWRAIFILICTLLILTIILFILYMVYIGHELRNVTINDTKIDYSWMLYEFYSSESGISQIIIGVGAIIIEISLFMLFFLKNKSKTKKQCKLKKRSHIKDENENDVSN
ncbi:MAG: hypothetical protein K2P14_07835, partial [Anaeroplasmataceae bacterium]|nr:hypothetical protein [Anaeroplasmataceae bacterium]